MNVRILIRVVLFIGNFLCLERVLLLYNLDMFFFVEYFSIGKLLLEICSGIIERIGFIFIYVFRE